MDKSFFLIGGAAWINLVNTRVMRSKVLIDLLQDAEIAKQWLEANESLAEDRYRLDGTSFARIHDELIDVRELCIQILTDVEREGALSGHTRKVISEKLESVTLVPVLSHRSDKPYDNPILEYRGLTAKDQIDYSILHSAIQTLSSVTPDRIRSCEHKECILHFVDVSKSGRRRWCSMEGCGNRNKAAQYYDKKRKV